MLTLSQLTLLLLLAGAPPDGADVKPAADAAPARPAAQSVEPMLIVETNDHQTAEGKLVALGPAGLTVRNAQGDREFPLKSLLMVSPGAKPGRSLEKPLAFIELVDHSLLAALDFQTQSGVGTARLVGGIAARLPTRAIHSVHFISPGARDEAVEKQWNEIQGGKINGDLLVVRKKGALDYLEGVLQDFGPESLTFLLDKEPIVVKRPKIEGLVYYHGAGEPLADAIAEFGASSATRVRVRSIALVDSQYKLTTPAGVELSVPASQLAQLDFSAGKVRYLSDLEPDSQQTAHYFASREPLESWEEYFRLRRDSGPEHGPLRLAGKSYPKGISAHSRTVLAYRLPGEFRQFEALVGVDDEAGSEGAAVVEIRGDGKPLWRGASRAGQPPQALSLPVAGVRRLEILIDFGDDLDIADFVDLCEARVTK
jgi:hypothetical protein